MIEALHQVTLLTYESGYSVQVFEYRYRSVSAILYSTAYRYHYRRYFYARVSLSAILFFGRHRYRLSQYFYWVSLATLNIINRNFILKLSTTQDELGNSTLRCREQEIKETLIESQRALARKNAHVFFCSDSVKSNK